MAFSNPYAPVVTQVSLPFSGPIPGGLTNDKQIQIQGVVQDYPQANGFSINLCEGMQISPNCALHFNPRFTERCVVRNAMLSGSWGQEERGGDLPIVKGQPFEVIIMCTPSSYFVAVNGRHFTEFKHRMPMANVKHLNIAGDFLKINFIKYEGGHVPAQPYGQPPAPGFAPPPYTPPYNPGGFVSQAPGMRGPAGMVMPPQNKYVPPTNDILYNPPVPLTQPISGRLYPNRMICISGTPLPNAKRFTINLRSGPSGNINFHFDVRINHMGEHNVVVRNSLVKGNWGKEEREASYFPFIPNAPFDILILAEATNFKVAVNNSHFIAFAYRQPLDKSDTLNVTGDVRITSLRFQ